MHSNANWHTVGSSWKQIVPKVHLLTLHLFIKLVKSNIQNASTLLLMTGKQGQTSMGEGNQTFVLEFTLLGLSQDPKIQILLFCVFLIVYLLSVFGNLLIIILIFAGIKIIVAHFAHVCKQTTKIVRREMLQTHVDTFHPKTSMPFLSMKKLQKTDLHP